MGYVEIHTIADNVYNKRPAYQGLLLYIPKNSVTPYPK
jgi:hypothetical protein